MHQPNSKRATSVRIEVSWTEATIPAQCRRAAKCNNSKYTWLYRICAANMVLKFLCVLNCKRKCVSVSKRTTQHVLLWSESSRASGKHTLHVTRTWTFTYLWARAVKKTKTMKNWNISETILYVIVLRALSKQLASKLRSAKLFPSHLTWFHWKQAGKWAIWCACSQSEIN